MILYTREVKSLVDVIVKGKHTGGMMGSVGVKWPFVYYFGLILLIDQTKIYTHGIFI